MGRLRIGLILALVLASNGFNGSVASATDNASVGAPVGSGASASVSAGPTASVKPVDVVAASMPAAVEKPAEAPDKKPVVPSVDPKVAADPLARAKAPVAASSAVDKPDIKSSGDVKVMAEMPPEPGAGEGSAADRRAVAVGHYEAGSRYLATQLEVAAPSFDGGEPDPEAIKAQATNLELALGEYELAVRADPAYYEAHLAVGNTLLKLSRPGDAADALANACRLRPGEGRAWALLGRCREGIGQLQAAAEAYGKAAVLLPLDRQVLEPLATLHERLGNWDAAVDAFRRLRVLDRNELRYLRGLGHCLLEKGQDRVALAILLNLVNLDPSDYESRVRVAEIQNRLGRHAQAAAMLKDVISTHKNDANANLQYAIALVAMKGRRPEKHLELAVKNAGGEMGILLRAAGCYDRLFDLDESVPLLERVRKHGPAHEHLGGKLALRYLLQGRPELAVKEWRREAQKLAPMPVDLTQRFVWLALARGNRGAADELLARRLLVTVPSWEKRCGEALLGRCSAEDLLDIAKAGQDAQVADAWLTIALKADADRAWAKAAAAYQQFIVERGTEQWSDEILFAGQRVRSIAAMN